MSDGYEAETLATAFRLAARLTAAEGITKSAGGGYSRRLEVYARDLLPLAGGIVGLAARMDGNLEKMQRLHEEHQAMKSAATQTFDMSLGREPRGDVPYTPERFGLRSELVPVGDLEKGSAA